MFDTLIKKDLKLAIKALGFIVGDIDLSIPENIKFGDYSSNISLQLAKQKHKNNYHSPLEIATAILEKLGHPKYLQQIEIAPPGFINFYLKDYALAHLLDLSTPSSHPQSKDPDHRPRILLEYAQPNTHKPFHIGHLRNISIGESMARLLEANGNEIFRATYGGDIGPHVAKALWGINKLNHEYIKVKASSSLLDKALFLGKAYVEGADSYDKDPKIKQEIDDLNAKIYQSDPSVIPIWQETVQWSKAYLDALYSRLGTEFDASIWESEVQKEGITIVNQNLNKVFIKDQDAIIFPGEKYGLHNRVFITSKGYPTYEAKEIGLSRKEESLFPFDQALYLIGSEQSGYFAVVTKAIELIDPHLVGRKKHYPFGMVNLSTGKMSSRKGNVVTAEELIEQVKQKIKDSYPQKTTSIPQYQKLLEQIAIGAIKFYMLKFSIQSPINFDIEKSISLQGDSAPYIQYTYARTQSILANSSKFTPKDPDTDPGPDDQPQPANLVQTISNKINENIKLEQEERDLLRHIDYFDLIIKNSAKEFNPNLLCNYILELAKLYNLFYQKHPILHSKKEDFRLTLTQKVGESLKTGLYLLGIEAPSRM